MKHKMILFFVVCAVFLTACGSPSGSATAVTESPWPSHAPDATPYVRLKGEAMPAQDEVGESAEPITFDSLYTTEGDFYGNKWEMQMFREELPQDEPYRFVIRTNAMLSGGDTADDHIALAKRFTELGCEAKVKEMRSIEDGQEYIAWVTIVTTTPSHLWELSDSLGEQLHVEQLYPQVDTRFETQIWPEE